MQVIDADGHVNEGARSEELVKYMPKGCRASQIFPVLDHLHFHYLKPTFGQKEFGNPGPKEWLEFLEKTEIDWTVAELLLQRGEARLPRVTKPG